MDAPTLLRVSFAAPAPHEVESPEAIEAAYRHLYDAAFLARAHDRDQAMQLAATGVRVLGNALNELAALRRQPQPRDEALIAKLLDANDGLGQRVHTLMLERDAALDRISQLERRLQEQTRDADAAIDMSCDDMARARDAARLADMLALLLSLRPEHAVASQMVGLLAAFIRQPMPGRAAQ